MTKDANNYATPYVLIGILLLIYSMVIYACFSLV